MKKVSVKCPKCGANLEVEAAEVNVVMPVHCVPTSIAVEIPVPANKLNEAEAKIEALRNAGVNVANLFSIRGTDSSYEVGRLTDGQFAVVPDDDPIFAAIRASKTIPDRRLFRRWVMAQVFHMMTETDYKTGQPIGFTAALRRKGYKYQWEMVVEELRVQARLNVTDPENFAERNRWFNRGVVVQMATDYIKLVRNIVTKLRIRSCKGVPYVRLDGTNIFIKDLPTKVYEPLEKLLRSIRNTRQPAALYRATTNFYKAVKETCLFFDMEQSRAFKDAYKGAGAFFTLKNLILFHDCGFPKMSQKMSREYLYELASQKDLEGYKLFGILKDFLVVNGINIEAMRAEWRK